jgi:hypothetical protein
LDPLIKSQLLYQLSYAPARGGDRRWATTRQALAASSRFARLEQHDAAFVTGYGHLIASGIFLALPPARRCTTRPRSTNAAPRISPGRKRDQRASRVKVLLSAPPLQGRSDFALSGVPWRWAPPPALFKSNRPRIAGGVSRAVGALACGASRFPLWDGRAGRQEAPSPFRHQIARPDDRESEPRYRKLHR